MSYLEPKVSTELPVEVYNWVMDQYKKDTRSPRIREEQKLHDREICASILKIVDREGFMTKQAIIDLSSLDGDAWTLSQYSTRMTKLIKDHPHQIKYNKNLKRIDKVKSSKPQEKLKLKNYGIS